MWQTSHIWRKRRQTKQRQTISGYHLAAADKQHTKIKYQKWLCNIFPHQDRLSRSIIMLASTVWSSTQNNLGPVLQADASRIRMNKKKVCLKSESNVHLTNHHVHYYLVAMYKANNHSTLSIWKCIPFLIHSNSMWISVLSRWPFSHKVFCCTLVVWAWTTTSY